MPNSVLDNFFVVEKATYGKASYFFKHKTFSSKVRAFYARPFCPKYIQSFSTTLYPNTFYAEKKEGKPQSCVETEFHENVHKWDRWKEGVSFNLKYLWPHWMLLPFLVAVIIIAGWWGLGALGAALVLLHLGLFILATSARNVKDGIPTREANVAFYVLAGLGLCLLLAGTVVGAGWWGFLWLGVFLFASPWPIKPFWRRDYEIRGYTMSLYRTWMKHKHDFDVDKWRETLERYAKIFSGPSYLFMELNEDKVRAEFLFQMGRLRFSERGFLKNWIWSQEPGHANPEKAEPYRMAKRFIESEGVWPKK